MMKGMMRTLLAFGALSLMVSGQNPDAKSTAGNLRIRQAQIVGVIQRSIDKMPEEHFAFKPVDTVRSFAELASHVSEAQYAFCAAAAGEKSPGVKVPATGTKADLSAAFAKAAAYCDNIYKQATDASAAEAVKLFGTDLTRGGALAFNTAHLFEHYGNMVTYMRIKGIVPPSSEPRK
jgi:uncharacterized damage-inducible protein DinB